MRKDLEELLEGKTEQGRLTVVLKEKKWRLRTAVVLLAALLIFSLFMKSFREKKLQEQLDQQQEQLERQQQLITLLEDKQDSAHKKSVPVITGETIRRQLDALRELVTQEYIYTNADKRETDAEWIFGWKRPFSDSCLIVTYDGTIKAGIDFNEVQIDVDEEKRVVTVTMPASKITDNTIPQETIVVVEARNGLFNEITFDDYNTFISEQKLLMEQKAIDYGLLEKADEEARAMIEAFLSAMPGIGTGEDEYRLVIE